MVALLGSLKRRRSIVYFMIFAFLYMSCINCCSKPKEQDKREVSEGPAPSNENNKPCDCPPDMGASGKDALAQKVLTPEDKNRISERLDRYFRALNQSVKKIPRETFDPTAVVENVGSDPKVLFEWVRDNTLLVPYKGLLRGAKGVLMDRLGNSLDRATLLAQLLESTGHRVRLAHAILSQEKAVELLQSSSTLAFRSVQGGGEVQPSIAETIEKHAAEYGLEAIELRTADEILSRDSVRLAQEARERTAKQSMRLAEMVGTPSMARGLEEKERRACAEALKDHWWVQVENEAAWLDLDATLPDMDPGQSLVEASEVVLPQEISNEFYHTVDIRLVIERWETGRLVKESVLECTLRPCELLDETIALNHFPLNWPEDASIFTGEAAQEKLKTIVLEETEWLPVLRLGSRQVTASSFKDTGEINEQPGKKTKGQIGGITGGIFGALGGKEEKAETKKGSLLTAEWIEYDIHCPGKPVRTSERQVFDLVGPAARKAGKIQQIDITESDRLERGLALLAESDILVQVCGLSPEYMTHLMASRLLSNWDTLSRLFLDVESTQQFFGQIQQLTPLPGPEYGLVSARREWSPDGYATFLGSPNIVVFVSGMRLNGRKDILAYRAFDIVENRLDVLPNAKLNAFEVRLRQGVLDTNVEDIILSGLGKRTDGTSLLFAESDVQGIKWLAVRNARDKGLRQLDLPDDARALIERDLAAGYIILAPEKAVQIADRSVVGWWRVDPETGQTLGLSASGWGQGLTEHKLLWGFKIAGWTLCGVETAMMVGEQASGHAPHPVTAVFVGSCWALGITSAVMAIAGYHGAAAWVIVIVEVQSFFMGMGVHAGMAQNSSEKK